MIFSNMRMSSLLDLLVFFFILRYGARLQHEIPNFAQTQSPRPLKEKSPNHPQDPHKPEPRTKRSGHPTSILGGARNNVKSATPLVMKSDQHQNPPGAPAREDPQYDQRPPQQAKSQHHAKHGTPLQTPTPDSRSFLCFSKESKTNCPKQFIIDSSLVSKRYFILSVSLHDWKSFVAVLSTFCKKLWRISSFNGHSKRKWRLSSTLSSHLSCVLFFLGSCSYLFGIIITDSAIPSKLYFKSVYTTPEFYKGTFMSSVVYKYNIIFKSMVWLILSIKT